MSNLSVATGSCHASTILEDFGPLCLPQVLDKTMYLAAHFSPSNLSSPPFPLMVSEYNCRGSWCYLGSRSTPPVDVINVLDAMLEVLKICDGTRYGAAAIIIAGGGVDWCSEKNI